MAPFKRYFDCPASQRLWKCDAHAALVTAESPRNRTAVLEISADVGSRPGARDRQSEAGQDFAAYLLAGTDQSQWLNLALTAQSSSEAVIRKNLAFCTQLHADGRHHPWIDARGVPG
jgi:hypothetical protein